MSIFISTLFYQFELLITANDLRLLFLLNMFSTYFIIGCFLLVIGYSFTLHISQTYISSLIIYLFSTSPFYLSCFPFLLTTYLLDREFSNLNKVHAMNRRKAREIAVQMLYGLYFEDIPEKESEFASLLERKFNEIIFESDVTFTLDDKDFCIHLVVETYLHLPDIDDLIKKFSKKWSFERITIIEKSILRLAIMELEFSDIPGKVAINEAIELAEDFSGQQSKKFVNGILDAVMHRDKND